MYSTFYQVDDQGGYGSGYIVGAHLFQNNRNNISYVIYEFLRIKWLEIETYRK